MIEFKGELSAETHRFVGKIYKKLINILCIYLMIVIIVFTTILTIVTREVIFTLCYGITVVCLIGLCCKPPKKDIDSLAPSVVTINDGEIKCEGKKYCYVRSVEHVKKVIDYGSFYYFVFKIFHKEITYVCQKDLITQGSIEEFENLFEGKIERRASNENE